MATLQANRITPNSARIAPREIFQSSREAPAVALLAVPRIDNPSAALLNMLALGPPRRNWPEDQCAVSTTPPAQSDIGYPIARMIVARLRLVRADVAQRTTL